ncbi:MAG: hypothetical protein JWL63_1517 [Rhodocyclales bacterium]|nr:hypothetical protein [Rhodocyclales bacterium]
MSNSTIGSDAWKTLVFKEPPARQIKGKRKWTHRHLIGCEPLGGLVWVESRNEYANLIALEYLWRRGRIKRFKPQPFTTSKDDFGREYTPDFMAIDDQECCYVIESKTARFVAREDEVEFERLTGRFAEFGMGFQVWTDRTPLIHPLRHNLQNMRRASAEWIAAEETTRLRDILGASESCSLRSLFDQDVDITAVFKACWDGYAYLPLTQVLGEQTLVSAKPMEDLLAHLFGVQPSLASFWDNLLEAA